MTLVLQQVCVGASTGEVFETYLGTKQGSELSPLLFGVFIDILHELITMEVPGAGPIIGNMHVPDIQYADDGTLIAMEDPQQIQAMLQCLELFCDLFGMRVNTAPHKTCIVVFRKSGTSVPRSLVFTFKGVELPIVDKYKYLGLILHATKGMRIAANALATVADRAVHTMVGRCRVLHLTQFAFKCRLFDALVEPTLSYGCHVWGPELIYDRLDALLNGKFDGIAAEHVHVAFLRRMAGVGKAICSEVLLRDFHRNPIWHHWLLLGTRWFLKLQAMQHACPHSLAYNAWLSDIDLMLEGCTDCWTYKVLYSLHTLCGRNGVLSGARWSPILHDDITRDDILGIHLDINRIQPALHDMVYRVRWECLGPDPHAASQLNVLRTTHMAWVMPQSRKPPHLQLCLPFKLLQCLAKYRTGGHNLRVCTGRHDKVPRGLRYCPLCSVQQSLFQTANYDGQPNRGVEDLEHFLLKCPAYNRIRSRYPAVFSTVVVDNSDTRRPPRGAVASVMCCPAQQQLACCIFAMDMFRTECMKLPNGSRVALARLTGDVEADIQLIKEDNL